MNLGDFLASENGPAWLPASVAEARKLVYIGQLLALVFTLIALLVGIIRLLTGNLIDGIGSLVAAALGLVVVLMVKDNVFNNIDQGKFKPASDALLIWSIVGFFVYVIPGLVMLLGFLKMQDIFQPQYQQYQAQQYVAQQNQPAPPQQPAPVPPQPVQPAPPQPAQPASTEHKKVEMAKCRKCGVNFPAFMHSCPNCNEPRR